jgi:hypothetical protein
MAGLAKGGIGNIDFDSYISAYCSAVKSSSVDKVRTDAAAWGALGQGQ